MLTCEENINKLKDTFNVMVEVRNKAEEERTQEETINQFLDRILELKAQLKTRTDELNIINSKVEGLTWMNNIDEDCLKQIDEIIQISKQIRKILIQHYVILAPLRKKNIASEEIKKFKNAIDNLRENTEDLYSIYFILPNMAEFVETTQKLESL